MEAPSRFLNKSKGEELFKELAGVERFEGGLWEHVEQLCFDYFEILAKNSGQKVTADGRTVIDITDVTPPSGGGKPTPNGLFEKLISLSAADIANFNALVDDWVHQKKNDRNE